MFGPMPSHDQGSYMARILPGPAMTTPPAPPYQTRVPVQLLDGDWLDLPLLTLPPDHDTAIAYLCLNQTGFVVEDRLAAAVTDLVRPLRAEIVVGMPTLGTVLASAVARRLGHPDYVPLSYSRKFWYTDELSTQVISITSPGKPKTVFVDPRLLKRLEGRRVLLVEDVISTGGTVAGELDLMRRIGADIVGIAVAIKETRVWVDRLAAIDPRLPAMVHAPASYPLFRRSAEGWVPDLATLPETV